MKTGSNVCFRSFLAFTFGRGSAHDFQQLAEIRDEVGLDNDLLVERFRTEMTHVLGDKARIKSNFVELIDHLFGELRRVDAERVLRDWT